MASIRLLLLFFLILDILGSRLVQAQTDLDERAAGLFERISNERDNLTFFIDYNGNLVVRQEGGRVPPFPHFFAGEFVASSLQIKPQVVAKLDKLARQFVASELRIKQHGDSKDESKLKDESNSNLPLNQFVSKVKNCLGPAGLIRLLEIQRQCIEARKGVSPFASESRLSDRSTRKSVYDFLLKEEERILAESKDIWLKPLNEQQRKMFDREWPFDRGTGRLAFMAVSLDYKTIPDVDRILKSKRSGFLFPNVAIYSQGVDGNLVASVPDVVAKKRSDLSRCYAAMHILFSDYTKETLNIQANQIAKLNDIKSQFQQQKNQVIAQTAEDFLVTVRHHEKRILDNGEIYELVLYDWPEDNSEIVLVNQRRLSPIAKTCLNDMLDVLIPQQLESLKDDFQNVAIRSLGPAAEMDHGSLGDLLNLSEQQKELLEKNRGDSLAFIHEETLTVFAEAKKRLEASLSAEIKRDRKRTLGKPCDFKRKDIGIWAWQLILEDSN